MRFEDFGKTELKALEYALVASYREGDEPNPNCSEALYHEIRQKLNERRSQQ